MTNTVTLATGEIVDIGAPAWRLECLVRHNHILNMRRLNLQMRRGYLESVARKEGQVSRDRLAAAFTTDWEESRKGSTP